MPVLNDLKDPQKFVDNSNFQTLYEVTGKITEQYIVKRFLVRTALCLLRELAPNRFKAGTSFQQRPEHMILCNHHNHLVRAASRP